MFVWRARVCDGLSAARTGPSCHRVSSHARARSCSSAPQQVVVPLRFVRFTAVLTSTRTYVRACEHWNGTCTAKTLRVTRMHARTHARTVPFVWQAKPTVCSALPAPQKEKYTLRQRNIKRCVLLLLLLLLLLPGHTRAPPTRNNAIGWVYGIPSDPLKVALFREASRQRRACVEAGRCNVSSSAMQRFDRMLVKVPEHTWGVANQVGSLWQ